MHLLLVVATPGEALLLRQSFDFQEIENSPCLLLRAYVPGQTGPFATISLLYTGLGMVNTAFALGHVLARLRPDAALQFGVAGTLNTALPLGTVVEVVSDTFSELGAEDHDNFLTPNEMGLNTPVTHSAYAGEIPWPIALTAPQVAAITVNTVHGRAETVTAARQRHPNATESMEGAAFFLACERLGIPCRAFRGISNYVEPRNRASWQLMQAATAVQQHIIQAIKG